MKTTEWLLTAAERGNPLTVLDRRHPDGRSWSAGNDVHALVHGATYFSQLLAGIERMVKGDVLLFTDWRGDPDELLGPPGTEISRVLGQAAFRGVVVRGLVWRSHLDRLQFSERENRHLGEEIDAAGGLCLLDMRVRPGGSHHQKFVVLRHPGRPEQDVAFVGGIDLCHSRHDDERHLGDRQPQPMAAAYSPHPPWHDVQVAIRGPAVGDVETVFRERWDDPAPLSRNPMHRLRDRMQRISKPARWLPPQTPDPPECGTHAVQLLRTYPYRRKGYPFAPGGERSVARGVSKVLKRARHLVYLEDQYFWSLEVAAAFCQALTEEPGLRLIGVLPRHPDQDGRLTQPPNLIGRRQALSLLHRAGGARVAFYGLENPLGTPVYVHAKVCIADDVWASVGSDNFNRRSWTHDSELSCVVVDHDGAGARGGNRTAAAVPSQDDRSFAAGLRLALAREHLERADGDDSDLEDPEAAFAAFAESAAALDAWHSRGRRGPRPPGRLRTYREPELSAFTRAWATPLYRLVYDPDGRPRRMRRAAAW